MSDPKVISQVEVIFEDSPIYGALVSIDDSNRRFVTIRPICDRMGIAWPAQRRRLNDDDILKDKLITIPLKVKEERGEVLRDMVCLDLDYLNGWLFKINSSKIKDEEVRTRVMRYQESCYRVLYEAMQEGQLSTETSFDDLLDQASADAVEAYQVALAIVKLARNQVMLEAQLGQYGRLLDDHSRRLESIEATLSDPDRYISREQASRISQAVRAIGHVLSERSGRSEFGAVYGELYRSFEISAYRELPASQYDQAMAWLNAWYQRLTNNNIPF